MAAPPELPLGLVNDAVKGTRSTALLREADNAEVVVHPMFDDCHDFDSEVDGLELEV